MDRLNQCYVIVKCKQANRNLVLNLGLIIFESNKSIIIANNIFYISLTDQLKIKHHLY